MPDRHLLAGARHLRPIEQGNLSRLCGLYSVINAIRLRLYPQVLTKRDLQAMYVYGVRHLARRRQLNRVIGVGMHEEAWWRLAQSLVEYTSETHGTAIRLEPLLPDQPSVADRARALAAIRKWLCKSSPVLVSFGGALDHFTVISGYTEQRLVLFDSSGLRWLRTDNFGFGESSSQRHWVGETGLIAVTANW